MGSKSCIRLVWLLLDVKKSACETSFLSQNPGVQSAWHPNNCFSTIPIHLIHPQNDFGWFRRGSMGSKNHCFSTIPIHLIHPQNDLGWFKRGSMVGSKFCIRLVWLLLDVKKSACETSFLSQNPQVSNQHGTQTIASQLSQFT
jgi:hypothetical protein